MEEPLLKSDSFEGPVLTRLLILNNEVHDLENQLRYKKLPRLRLEHHVRFEADKINDIARMQDEMDQNVRASLTTCWLGMPNGKY